MSYGFDKSPVDAVQLPSVRDNNVASKPPLSQVLQAGAELGFVSRDASARRKPGPRRIEAQDKITVTGPKRIIDQLKAYSDAMGGVSYCEAIEALLENTRNSGK